MGGKHVVLLYPQLMIEKVCSATAPFSSTTEMASVSSNLYLLQAFYTHVFHGDHCLRQLLAQPYPLLPGHSLPASQCLPERAGSELLGSASSIIYLPCVFWGIVLCGRVWLTLQTVEMVVCEHRGPDWLLIQHQKGRANQNLLLQGLLCWPWEVELGLPTNSMSNLMLVKNCELLLCICRNWTQ